MGAAMDAHMEIVKAAVEPLSSAGYYLNFAERPVDTSLSFDIDTYSGWWRSRGGWTRRT